ncbi:MAG: glycosyltransferase family 1 protein [Deltaproteobacteria bacterium]|nr:glycosyltransferase family 1 protein [Deltaproteobacteria bacterium]
MRERVKEALQANPVGRAAYALAQELWFDHTYRARVERYVVATEGTPDAYRPSAHVARALRKIQARGYTPKKRPLGEIHTFAYVPSHWWHQNQIAAALPSLGPTTRFDYEGHGFTLKSLHTRTSGHLDRRREVMNQMLEALKKAHRERPVDWFLSYALGYDITPEAIQRIKDEVGIPIVNVSFDDKNWWDEIERGDPSTGMKQFAPHVDLAWTSASNVLPWYWAEDGQALFVPEGVNVDWFKPMEVARDIEVGFVGNNFGYRPELLRALQKAGIKVSHFGMNWSDSRTLDDAEMRLFFNRCWVNLGHGDMHYSKWLTNLKGRDFEIPSVGRGVYITTYNSDLAACFELGHEIQCYRGLDELIDLLRHHLRNRDESDAMAARARARCIREHQWQHRFHVLLRALGILPASEKVD